MKPFTTSLTLFLTLLLSLASWAQGDPAVASGPMIGHVSMRSVQLWIQTKDVENVFVKYKAKNSSQWSETSPQSTSRESAFTAHVALENLEPGTDYDVIFVVGGEDMSEALDVRTQLLWDYRMDPPPFSFVTGSCAYINEPQYDRPGKPYGGGYEIFESMAADEPDMMLWLGDNIYLREVDFQSYSGFLHRYSHARQTPEMATLLKACPNYAIWDDHDFGPNDSDGSWIHADWSRKAFKTFWSKCHIGF